MNETNHPSSLATCTLIQDLLNVKEGGIYEAVVQLKQQLEAREREVIALTNECVQMKAIIDAVTDLDNEPQYHCEGMGCGLEDRGITDRYDAMEYGWEQAMERIYGEVIPCTEELSFPATDAALAAVEERGVEKFADVWDADTAKIMEGPFFYGHIEQREAFSKCVRAYLVELREGRV
ncbi:hypothetical protein [Serratia sp. 14-2641]|uniref:hypothetical protein n=1 Tax=Serratia sp. 14-2641 TaxID=1841657 RepID=UPI0009434E28|nr:hypothetical protein [Serratia sp. 14-2641]